MFSNAKTATCPIGLLGAPSVPNPQTLAKRAAPVQQRPTVRVQDAARLGQIKRKFSKVRKHLEGEPPDRSFDGRLRAPVKIERRSALARQAPDHADDGRP